MASSEAPAIQAVQTANYRQIAHEQVSPPGPVPRHSPGRSRPKLSLTGRAALRGTEQAGITSGSRIEGCRG